MKTKMKIINVKPMMNVFGVNLSCLMGELDLI